MKSNIGAILLAAGHSERMGQCKFLLKMADGLTFFENIIQIFSKFGIQKISVVTQAAYQIELEKICIGMKTKPVFILNAIPESEKFYSLQLGLESLENMEYCFIHNADSPFIDLASLELLASNKNKADYICPVYNNKGGHPILVNKKTMKYLALCPSNSNLKDELKTRSRYNVNVTNDLITVDIDTPQDYQKYFN